MAKKRGRAAELSRRLELLWGASPRAARGPRPALSIERIVRAAVAIADKEGLDAITMQRLAARVGVTTMALYRYVATKAELIDGMIEAALGPPPAMNGPEPWRDRIATWARANIALYLRHPWLLTAIVSRPPFGPNQIAWFDAALRALADSGLRPDEMVSATTLVDDQVRGAAQFSLAMTNRDFVAGYGRALDRAIGDSRFPALSAAAAAGAFANWGDDASWTPFDFGLERVLDGVESYLGTRRARSRAR